MRKIVKLFMLILLAFCLFGCETNPENTENKSETKTLDLTEKITLVTFEYNEWGSEFSKLQSTYLGISELFEGKLPKKGDTLELKWKGKSDKAMKNLYMLVADVEWLEHDGWGKCKWTHLLSEETMHTPVITDIKADTEFEINTEFKLIESATHNVYVFFCYGEEDSEASNFLYNTKEKPFIPVILGQSLSGSYEAELYANKITWPKGTYDGAALWNLTAIDLSEYESAWKQQLGTTTDSYNLIKRLQPLPNP